MWMLLTHNLIGLGPALWALTLDGEVANLPSQFYMQNTIVLRHFSRNNSHVRTQLIWSNMHGSLHTATTSRRYMLTVLILVISVTLNVGSASPRIMNESYQN